MVIDPSDRTVMIPCQSCSRRALHARRGRFHRGCRTGPTPWRAPRADLGVAIGDLLVRNRDSSTHLSRTRGNTPGRLVVGWPMDPVGRTPRSNNRLVLVRLDAGRLSAATRDQAASGVMAYSAVCTHEGCSGRLLGRSGTRLSVPVTNPHVRSLRRRGSHRRTGAACVTTARAGT